MTVPTSDVILDPYDYDFHEDPYPYYKRLRDEAPLYHNEELGFWALSRHGDVLHGFRNSTTLSNRDGVSLDPISRGPHASKTMSYASKFVLVFQTQAGLSVVQSPAVPPLERPGAPLPPPPNPPPPRPPPWPW